MEGGRRNEACWGGVKEEWNGGLSYGLFLKVCFLDLEF